MPKLRTREAIPPRPHSSAGNLTAVVQPVAQSLDWLSYAFINFKKARTLFEIFRSD